MKERKSFNDSIDIIDDVIHTLLEEYGVTIDDYAYSHKANVCAIRQALWKWIYETFDVSTCFLGGLFARNHATIIAGINRARWLLEAHDNKMEEIRDKISLIYKLHYMDKKKRIYVSIPSSQNEEESKERARRAIAKFKAQGYENVLTSTDVLGLCYSENRELEWMGRRIENILMTDVAVFASGWFEDKRCLLEKDACQRFGIETFTDGKI
jgi:hypothetical protein